MMGSGIWEEVGTWVLTDGSLPRRVMGSGIWEEVGTWVLTDGSLPRRVMLSTMRVR